MRVILIPQFSAPADCADHDPDMWFRDGVGGNHSGVEEARKICHRCKVRTECLEWAMEHDESGMWGGLSQQELENLKRKRARDRLRKGRA